MRENNDISSIYHRKKKVCIYSIVWLLGMNLFIHLWQPFQYEATCVKWGVSFNGKESLPNCKYLAK